jgi:hypothetical protein
MPLDVTLNNTRNEIEEFLHIGYANWDELISRVNRREQRGPNLAFEDEQIWTFLVGCGYAVSGQNGVAALIQRLTGENQTLRNHGKIWFEVLPDSPRLNEGKTHVDLAIGTILQRLPTQSGIELDDVMQPWVCFCEMKWYSDISTGVTYDVVRNQWARVIENALAFRGGDRLAERVVVTLVTPNAFDPMAEHKSRLFQYKFVEYVQQPAKLIMDLQACTLEKVTHYPQDMAQRVNNLKMKWVSYDQLFNEMPDNDGLAHEIRQFWQTHGNYQGRGL